MMTKMNFSHFWPPLCSFLLIFALFLDNFLLWDSQIAIDLLNYHTGISVTTICTNLWSLGVSRNPVFRILQLFPLKNDEFWALWAPWTYFGLHFLNFAKNSFFLIVLSNLCINEHKKILLSWIWNFHLLRPTPIVI